MLPSKSLFSVCFLVPLLPLEGNPTVPLTAGWITSPSQLGSPVPAGTRITDHVPMSMRRKTAVALHNNLHQFNMQIMLPRLAC